MSRGSTCLRPEREYYDHKSFMINARGVSCNLGCCLCNNTIDSGAWNLVFRGGNVFLAGLYPNTRK